MKTEAVCPNGHVIREDTDGSVCFTVQRGQRLKMQVECRECAKRWEMWLKVFSCDETMISQK